MKKSGAAITSIIITIATIGIVYFLYNSNIIGIPFLPQYKIILEQYATPQNSDSSLRCKILKFV